MNIRPAQPTDMLAIAAVQSESWQDTYADVLPAEFLANQLPLDLQKHWTDGEIQAQDVVLVAEDNEVIGFIAVWCRPHPYIENLHVKPIHRSKKVGLALMKAAAQHLLQQGQTTVYLWVVENNARAIRFYERLGGVQTDTKTLNLFGNDAPAVKIEWTDISTI